ncbi:uncharacterized protein LOC143846791 isoform X2 [Tasmannia lanceolata]|uniref:uncharacterized protein LOC143846791 isoform X2 n=1 Tax=Tasmannia lanceolata TaxID=3420 RepID=UPI004062E6E9
MFTSSMPISDPFLHHFPTVEVSDRLRNSQKKIRIGFYEKPTSISALTNDYFSPSQVLQKTIPLAASMAILLLSNPANAGILSGSTGLESIPGPQLPQLDFLTKFNENQKKYAEFDSRFKSSPILKELLEKSRLNKERNRQEIQDKYCIRGAEWGVGDCSTQGMTQEEKDNFIAMLKQKSEAK